MKIPSILKVIHGPELVEVSSLGDVLMTLDRARINRITRERTANSPAIQIGFVPNEVWGLDLDSVREESTLLTIDARTGIVRGAFADGRSGTARKVFDDPESVIAYDLGDRGLLYYKRGESGDGESARLQIRSYRPIQELQLFGKTVCSKGKQGDVGPNKVIIKI